MKYQTVIKARRHLISAKSSLDAMALLSEFDVEAYHHHWNQFLMSLGSIIEVLRSGTKAKYPAARQWVGHKFQNEILKDPLLRWLHHARGTEFHGTMHCASLTNGTHTIPYLAEVKIRAEALDGNEFVIGGPISFEGPDLNAGDTVAPFQFRMIPAVDEKNNNSFEVPESHFGVKLPDTLALTAGELAYRYYAMLLDEAESLSIG